MVAKLTPPLIVIVGPTASGKSDLAMAVARQVDGEIICADSRTIYKGMDIGTAKPSKQDQLEVPHHLLDVVEPDQRFTVADFKRLSNKAIDDIWSRGKLPILVGGSGLYIDSVIFNYQLGVQADPALREELSSKTIEELQEICRQRDIDMPENKSNKRYLIRAIELGGVVKHPKKLRDETIVVGISTDKTDLKKRVEVRARQMIEQGVAGEVAALGARYGWNSEAMKGNIYRVFRGVAEGWKDTDVATQEFIASDLKLVKKQITWFKRNKHIVWGGPQELLSAIEHFVATHKTKPTT